ncbi:hypothetical protein AZE42_10051, partial [Rhizopogon vesiculosus]
MIVEGAKDAPAPRPNKRRCLSDPTADPDPPFTRQKRARGSLWANEAKESHPVLSPTDPPETNTIPEGLDDNEAISDLEWMRRCMKSALYVSPDKVFEQSDDEHGDVDHSAVPDEPRDPAKDAIMRTSRLFLRNLAFSCTEAELMEQFHPFGEVGQVRTSLIYIKAMTNCPYTLSKQPTSALSAYEALDKKSFQGCLLHIIPAVDRKGRFEVEDGEGKKKSLKDERSSRRKATAGREFNWSMLYMNSDAVASSTADRMGIAKADIHNPESDNAAVKLALAETHVIQETKSSLEFQGVVLSSFSSRARSDTTILVKNIPYGTTTEQTREMFDVQGELGRVVVPLAGTMAVLEFVHADEAAKAFRAVAYRRLGNSVNHLERRPMGMFQETNDGADENSRTVTSTVVKPMTITGRTNLPCLPAREQVFGSVKAERAPIFFTEDVLDLFTIGGSGRSSTTGTTAPRANSHLTLLAVVDCWAHLNIQPFDHLDL